MVQVCPGSPGPILGHSAHSNSLIAMPIKVRGSNPFNDPFCKVTLAALFMLEALLAYLPPCDAPAADHL